MQISKKVRKKVQINVTSLIDVLFILLIFFMVTSTFLEQPGIKLELPKAQSAQVEQIENLIIYVDQQRQVFLNDKPVAIDRLEKLLKETIAENDQPTLVLRADKAVPHGLVVTIMDLAKRCGVKRLVIGTDIEQGNK
ncbi:biopolymer transporter ExbD [candidate division KSB1 bacterium]|nr:biopolymer transporter ExbD [candidate division KSB1 bacterium]